VPRRIYEIAARHMKDSCTWDEFDELGKWCYTYAKHQKQQYYIRAIYHAAEHGIED
jgi:hypothetical protein